MKKFIIAVVLCVAMIIPAPMTASALSPARQVAVCSSSAVSNLFGFQPWYACLPKDSKGNPTVKSLNDIFLIIFPIIDALAKASVLVAAAFMFMMLFKIMIARGDAGQISTGIMGIRDAGIGLVIAMIAVGIVNFIAGAF